MINRLKRLGAERWFAIGNVVVASIAGLTAFLVSPAPSLWITVPTVAVIALLVASAAGLALGTPWAFRVTRVAGVTLLAAGMIVTAVVALGMIFARAMSAVASPGGLVFALVLLAIVPYALVYPACLLVWADRARRRSA